MKAANRLNVVLFSGGRGSRVLSRELINNPKIALTIAINGYDDGASTGEVRRFLGNSLGPSDFRKNASRLARELRCCQTGLIDLLDLRFPAGLEREEALACLRLVRGERAAPTSEVRGGVAGLLADAEPAALAAVAERLARFEAELQRTGKSFCFSDCSLGNIVFAGSFLACGGDFNAAVADYCGLLNLPDGLIENVTDGTNACLVALSRDGHLLGSEADIVDASRRNHIQDIYLVDRPPTDAERRALAVSTAADIGQFLAALAPKLALNPRLADRLAAADLIIYSPGTQHSSLFPSYLTPNLGSVIARNLTAIKLLITNLEEDAEIPDSSAVDIIERAVHYMNEKDALAIPTPFLISHYLINDPHGNRPNVAYILPGRLDRLEDPRLVRIGHYEDGVTGCHDASKVLTPFIESILKGAEEPRVAVFLLDTGSLNKIGQTVCEMVRGGIERVPVSMVLLYSSEQSFDQRFADTMPFEICNVWPTHGSGEAALLAFARERRFDYAVLFESSGMYRGEDVVTLLSYLSGGRLDALWGSRRLSVLDIHESYMLRYRHNILLGAISYVGSHLLSLAYLVLYGRYISDTLSGVRAIRARYLERIGSLDDKFLNQRVLSMLLHDRAELFEMPVRFLAISPEKVRRTTLLEGLQSLGMIVWRRVTGAERGVAGVG